MKESIQVSIQDVNESLECLKTHRAWLDLWTHEARTGSRFSKGFGADEDMEMKVELGRFWLLCMKADNTLAKVPLKERKTLGPEIRRLAEQWRVFLRCGKD
jgi:hypothetical protein